MKNSRVKKPKLKAQNFKLKQFFQKRRDLQEDSRENKEKEGKIALSQVQTSPENGRLQLQRPEPYCLL